MWYSRFFRSAAFYGQGQAEWIDPSGNAIDTMGETHQGWMFKNQDSLDDIFEDFRQQNLERQDEQRDEEIQRIEVDLASCDLTDPDEKDYIQRLKNDLAFYKNSLGDLDESRMSTTRLVDSLIHKGWVRKVDKHGRIYFEFSGDNGLSLIEQNIWNGIQNQDRRVVAQTPICLQDLGNMLTVTFQLGDWLNSGMNLLEWVNSGDPKIKYEPRLADR